MIKESNNLMSALVDFQFNQFATVHIARMLYRLVFWMVLFSLLVFVANPSLRSPFSALGPQNESTGLLNFAWLVLGVAGHIVVLGACRLVIEHYVVEFMEAHHDADAKTQGGQEIGG